MRCKSPGCNRPGRLASSQGGGDTPTLSNLQPQPQRRGSRAAIEISGLVICMVACMKRTSTIDRGLEKQSPNLVERVRSRTTPSPLGRIISCV